MVLMFLNFQDIDERQYMIVIRSLKWGAFKKKAIIADNNTHFDFEGVFRIQEDWVNPIEVHKQCGMAQLPNERMWMIINDLCNESKFSKEHFVDYLYYDSDEMNFPEKLVDSPLA